MTEYEPQANTPESEGGIVDQSFYRQVDGFGVYERRAYFGGAKAPKTPPPPPPPKEEEPAVQQAESEARRRRAMARGFRSTVLGALVQAGQVQGGGTPGQGTTFGG